MFVVDATRRVDPVTRMVGVRRLVIALRLRPMQKTGARMPKFYDAPIIKRQQLKTRALTT